MLISPRQLRRLAADVDDLHRHNMKTFATEAADLHRDIARRSRYSTGDASLAGYAQGIELAAVAAYTAAAPLLSAGVLPVAELFMSHHQQHADAFGAVAAEFAVTEPNSVLIAAVTPTLESLTDEAGALEFAFVLEGQAAYTYAAALTLLEDPAYAAATSTILPIEAQHQTVLGLALGKDVSAVFPTGAFEAAALGDGTDPLKGLDPAVFAA